MEPVFFKSVSPGDTLVPVATVATTNGKIDFRVLGEMFGLEPCCLGGIAFSKNEDLLTTDSWTEIKKFLDVAGTKEDPAMVSGRPISAAPTVWIFLVAGVSGL